MREASGRWPCDLSDDGKIQPCWALAEVVQSSGSRGTRKQGVEMQTLVDMKELKFSRNLVVLKSGKHGSKGLTLNCCPFCGSVLNAEAKETLAANKSAKTPSVRS